MMKFKDIKETASNAVEIIVEFGTPQTIESLDKIKETAKTAQHIMDIFKDPEMVKSIENIRLTSEAINNAGDKMKKVASELNATGIVDETKETAKSIKNKLDYFGGNSNNNQNLQELATALKDTVQSLRDLADELKVTVRSSSSNQTNSIHTHNKEKALK
jgi:hypothetical protein